MLFRAFRLAPDVAVLLYAYLRQAERTVDGAIRGGWADVVSFYDGDRLGDLRRLQREIASVLGPLEDDGSERGPPRPFYRGRLRWLFGLGVRPQDGLFVRDTLSDLLRTLEAQDPPSPEDLVAMRMRLYDAQSRVVWLLPRSGALSALRDVEVLWHPLHQRSLTPAEILALVTR